MVQPMPESVKWTEVHGFNATPTAQKGYPFEMKMDRKEVLILLGLDYWWAGSLAAGNNVVRQGLWRKGSDPPSSVWAEGGSPDMIWSERHSIFFAAESVVSSKARDVSFPWPIVLIRPPRFVIRTEVITNASFSMRLYYLLREIGDVDLAKLMVKDHA